VVIFAILVAMGTRSIGKVFTSITKIEKWMRRGTGILFVLMGVYFTLKYSLGLF